MNKLIVIQSFTACRASYLMVKRQENRESEDLELLQKLLTQPPDLAAAVELAEEVLRLLANDKAMGLRLG